VSDVERELVLREQQRIEYEQWLAVVRELRARGCGAINAGEVDERLHDAIVLWGEELAQLRMTDPNIEHAMDALQQRRDKWERGA
jgi:hypothetical protein